MKTSLHLYAAAAKISGRRIHSLPILIALAAILCAARSASGSPCSYPLSPPYEIGPNGAPIICNIQEEWHHDQIPKVTLWFSTLPGDPVELGPWITPTWGYVSGDSANQLAEVQGRYGSTYSYNPCQEWRIYPAGTQNACSVTLLVLPDYVLGGIGIDSITFTFNTLTIPLTRDTIDVRVTGIPNTPEPTSLYLLGTGLLALVGAMRRNSRRS